MDFLNDLFGSEMGELKRHQKTEEEIKKFSTSEDFTELKRAVHLLKKGYEIQKISVRDSSLAMKCHSCLTDYTNR